METNQLLDLDTPLLISRREKPFFLEVLREIYLKERLETLADTKSQEKLTLLTFKHVFGKK